jgi:hypothetical protein
MSSRNLARSIKKAVEFRRKIASANELINLIRSGTEFLVKKHDMVKPSTAYFALVPDSL